MARTGPPAKDPATRVRRDQPALAVVRDEVPDPLAPPGRLRAVARRAWEGYFRSEVSRTFDPDADLPLLRRWVAYLDEWDRINAAIRRQDRVVPGSQNQPVLNPLIAYLDKLEHSLQRCEKELGMTPLARASLGLTHAQAVVTVQQINAVIQQRDDARTLDISDADLMDEFAQ